MNKTLAALLVAGGVIALVAGVIAGVVPIPSLTGTCGSVFAPEGPRGSTVDAYFVYNLCKQDLVGRAGLTWALIIAGAVALVVGIIGLTRKAVTPAAAETGETAVP